MTTATKNVVAKKVVAKKANTPKKTVPAKKADKVAPSVKISIKGIMDELLDKHGLEGLTFEMADKEVKKAKPDAGFNKNCFAWYKSKYKKAKA